MNGRAGGPHRRSSRLALGQVLLAVAAAISLAGISTIALGTPATQAAPTPSHYGPWVEVSPGNGRASEPFTATAWWYDGSESCQGGPTSVRFHWDVVDATPEATRSFSSACTATWTQPKAPTSDEGYHDILACVTDPYTGSQQCAKSSYYVDPTPTLALAPSSGLASSAFTATYDWPGGCGYTHAQFSWDGKPVATVALTSRSCGVTYTFPSAPDPNGPGQHTVSAIMCEGEDYCFFEGTEAFATYTVTLPPPISPPPTPKPTPVLTPPPLTPPPLTPPPTSTPRPSPSPSPRLTPSLLPSASPATSPGGSVDPGASPSGSFDPFASPSGSVDPSGLPSASPSDGSPGGPSPSGGVAQATGTPDPSLAPAGPIGPDGNGRNPRVPSLAAAIGAPDGWFFDPDVVLTNLLITLVLVFLFAVTSEIFNSTLDANRDTVHGWWLRLTSGPFRVFRPLLRADSLLDRLAGAGRWGSLAHAAIVLAVIGLIYGFLSPDFGLNEPSVILFVSLVVAVGFVTYFSEGSSSLLASRRFRAKTSIRLYGTAVVVAIVSVIASRLTNFEPGLLYGFVASSLILAPVALGRRDEAMLVLVPALGLLAVSVTAWILLQPVRAATGDGTWGWALVDSILAMVALAGLEGLVFIMIPLRFMDGAVIMQWSRVVWALVFGTAVFLWWQLLLNRDRAYAAAFEQTNVQLVLGVLAVFMLTTGLFWGYFRFRRQPEEQPA